MLYEGPRGTKKECAAESAQSISSHIVFDPLRNVESYANSPDHCPVSDRGLTATDQPPIVRCLIQRRLVGAPDIDVPTPSESPRAWPPRDAVESIPQYLAWVPTVIVGTLNYRREVEHDLPVAKDLFPVETAEVECISKGPLADTLLLARYDVRYDRVAPAPQDLRAHPRALRLPCGHDTLHRQSDGALERGASVPAVPIGSGCGGRGMSAAPAAGTSSGRGPEAHPAIDPLDIPWAELATPEGAPTPEEKRRQRAYADVFYTPERLRRLRKACGIEDDRETAS